MIIQPFWAMAKQVMLDPVTVSKVDIIGSNYLNTLLEYIDADSLPDYLGGKCTCQGGCTDHYDVGCWNE
jgi:hypothetical protein